MADSSQDDQDDKALAAQLVRFKQLRKVAGLLSFPHGNGCTRDAAGNRELHFEQVGFS